MAYTTIDDGSAHHQSVLFTGNGSTQSITNGGNSDLQPDWIWGSLRDEDGGARWVFDSSRGATNRLKTNATTVEQVRSGVTAFNSDGFTIGSHSDSNLNAKSLVAWQWKANGGTTSSNSSGDITSTVQANTTAGFSIVTYTGNGNDGDTVGHGLSGNWDLCILKNRGQTDYWTYSNTGTNQVLLLHDNVQQANHSTAYMSKASGVIGLVAAGDLGMVNGNSETYVAYVFKEIQGYSKFGNYKGNGNADGAFIYTGFAPAFVMTKRTDGSDHWRIVDNSRDPFNDGTYKGLKMNDTDTESDAGTRGFDFLSNGFKLRTTDTDTNGDNSYTYMAFAEHPFVSSKGVPATAR